MDADLDGEEAAVMEERRRARREPPVEVEAVRAARERRARLFEPDFRGEGGEVAVGDVGRIGEDGVIASARERREEVARVERDAVAGAERGGVLLGDGACRRADVDGVRLRLGQEVQDGEADAAAARADVGEAGRAAPQGAQALDGRLHENLRVGARHERVRRDLERETHELLLSDDVGDGDAQGALLDRLSIARELRGLERLVEVHVEVDALAPEHACEQHFRVEARGLDAFLGEILHRPFEQASDGPDFLHVSSPALVARLGPL